MRFFWAEGNFFHCPSQRLLLLEVIIEIHWSWKGAIILDYGFIFKKKKKNPIQEKKEREINILQYI